MKLFAISAGLSLAALFASACSDQTAAPTEIELPQAEAPSTAAPIAEPTPVEGWNDIPATSPALLDSGFSVTSGGGKLVTAEDLRGRWTIVAFWGLWSEDSIADVLYMEALRTAAAQDPDLDFLAVHTPPPHAEGEQLSDSPYGAYLSLTQGLTDQGAPFPTAEDVDGAAALSLHITSAPTYVLVGPDLAIEARRGAIAPDSPEGVKTMIRGVAEIRRQIASPN